MLRLLILSLISFSLTCGQNLIPTHCTSMLDSGSPSPYEARSIAAIYQTFCSVKGDVSQCLEKNKIDIISSKNPVDWALGMVFKKTSFDATSQKMCDSLASVHADLECLKAHQNSFCEAYLPAGFSSIHQQFISGNLTLQTAKATICGMLTHVGQCYKTQLSTCNAGVKQFLEDYYGLYSGNCLADSVMGSLPPEMRDSAFITCAFDTFSDAINSIMKMASNRSIMSNETILQYAFEISKDVCKKTDEFSTCLVERMATTTSHIDKIILQFIKMDNVKKVLDLQCSTLNDFMSFYKNKKAMAEVTTQTQMCGALYFKNVFNRRSTFSASNSIMESEGTVVHSHVGGERVAGNSFSGSGNADNISFKESRSSVDNTFMGRFPTISPTTQDVSEYKNTYCPGIKGMLNCMTIPISRSYPKMSSMMEDMVDMLLSDSCKALSDQGTIETIKNPAASVFVQCATPINLLLMKDAGINTKRLDTPEEIASMVIKSIDIVCSNAKWYLSCIDERIEYSNNLLDNFFKNIIDFSHDVNRTEIISEVCSKHVQDIKNSISCFMSKIPGKQVTQKDSELFKCVNKSLDLFGILSRPTELAKLDGNSIRSTFCSPVDNMISCAKSSFGACNSKLTPLFDNIPKAILRTDCGGVRPSTLPTTNTKKDNDPNSAISYRSKNIWTIVTFVITAVITFKV